MRKILLLSLLSFAVVSLSAELYIPRGDLGKLEVSYKDGFVIHNKDEGIDYIVQGYHLDATLREMSSENRQAFMRVGLLKVGRLSDGEYTLEAHGSLKGGGPISGAIAYWVTKSLCWAGVGATAAVATTAVITAAVATGGAAVGASAGAIAATTAAATTGAGVAVGAMGGGAAGAVAASMAASAIATSAAATATVTAATTGAAIAGGVGVVASIETASLAAGTAFTLCPFLP